MDEELLIEYDLLIKKIASHFDKSLFEDLYQEGFIGLEKAFKNYNPALNVKFSTYAYNYIYGEMYAFLVKNNPVKINKNILKMYKLIEDTRSRLTTELARTPSILEITKELNITPEEYSLIYNSIKKYISLDELVADDLPYYEVISKEEDSFDNFLLKEELSKLSLEEQKLLMLRYYYNYSQSEAATYLKTSQVTVSRKEQKVLKKLNTRMN